MRTDNRGVAAGILLAVGGVAGVGHAQVVINEVFENPPNGGDQTWEYIELSGPPGFDLTGFAVANIKGGEDQDPQDDMPDGALNQNGPEIDEAFLLDGWRIGPDGLFVLYNVGSFGFTALEPYLIPNPGYLFFQPESPANMRFLNGASFVTLSVPSVDVAGKLDNDGSSSYLLVRKRPNHSIDASGRSVYAPGYAWKKDVTPDIDFNSRLDFGDEHTLGVPVWYAEGLDGAQTTALQLEPAQIVDAITWSNAGGKEYAPPGLGIMEPKLSETPGFNPDAVARLRYPGLNDFPGSTINNLGELIQTTIADQGWIYGETLNVDPGTPAYGVFKPLFEPGPDALLGTFDDELNHMAPIDPDGRRYAYAGPGSPNPLVAPFFQYSDALDPAGSLLFEPYDISGFRMTPGTYNDAPSDSALIGTPIATQSQFVRGDVNFDGVVDFADRQLIFASIGVGLDDTTPAVNDRNNDDPADDVVYTAWKHQMTGFNSVLAMVRMDLSDGTTGEWNSGATVTQADADALAALVPQCSAADLAPPFGTVNFFDFAEYIGRFNEGDPSADIAEPFGTLNFFDVAAFLSLFNAGCP